MSDGRLERLISIACPFQEAPTRLRAFVRARRPQSARGGTADRNRRADSRTAPSRTAATFARRDDPGPFFAGALTAAPRRDVEGFFELHLRGEHRPPFVQVGRNFDATLGIRIADAAANDVLGRIRDWIEGTRFAPV